jgi:trans-aconitate 2-methyltransferase
MGRPHRAQERDEHRRLLVAVHDDRAPVVGQLAGDARGKSRGSRPELSVREGLAQVPVRDSVAGTGRDGPDPVDDVHVAHPFLLPADGIEDSADGRTATGYGVVMPFEWNARTYDALPLPHVGWGQRVLDRMRLTGTERVLDAGCGTGRDAAALLERMPGIDLVCLDASEQMIEAARDRLGDRATLVVADLTKPLPIAPVDAVMSVAAFHWVTDHELLFRNLAASVLPGGRLTSDCGGQGQVAILDQALVTVTGKPKQYIRFAGVDDTAAALKGGGWEVESVRLRPDPLRLDDPGLLESYLATVMLGAYLDKMPAEEHVGFVRAVREAMAEPVIDYVRLEIDAIRTA